MIATKHGGTLHEDESSYNTDWVVPSIDCATLGMCGIQKWADAAHADDQSYSNLDTYNYAGARWHCFIYN